MDSMLGYKNDKYLYFGRCAAKLDDVANYIPARISGWLDGSCVSIFVAALMCKNAWQRFTGGTDEIMQVRILHRQKLQWQEHWMYSLQVMHIILENFMRNRRSEMQSGR